MDEARPLDQPSPEAQARAARIAGIASLLSLDVATPFLQELTGLDVEPSKLQDPLRELIVEVRKQAETDEAAPSDFEARFRAMVERELGGDARRTLWHFIDEVYALGYAERPAWSGWHMAFKATSFRPETRDGLDLIPKRKALLTYFDGISDLSELQQLVDKLRQEPPTDWDLEVYARRSWDPSSDVSAPFRVILDNILMQRFRRFMREVDEQLDDLAQVRLTQWANRILDDLGVYKPEPLPTPRDLVGASS
ncbi:MAG TPA: hypothetical protein ENK57_16855 [Polyangiaceae bacterium]|nr:hypothetical protein [Polyangiaceae bacterium]